MNSCVLTGRLVADPELRTTPSGLSVCRFRIAVDRPYQKSGEDRKADFIDVVAWRSNADFVTKYFRKGSMIAVQGSLQTNNYEDKNGNKRTSYEIVADRTEFCGSKPKAEPVRPPAMRLPPPTRILQRMIFHRLWMMTICRSETFSSIL